MNKEEFVKEQMKLSKEDIIANYWYTYQDNVEKLGIEHQLNLKDKEIERLNKCIDTALETIIKDWYDKCTIPIHAVCDTGDDIRIKLYYQLFLKGANKK